jgi:hypothetical protein
VPQIASSLRPAEVWPHRRGPRELAQRLAVERRAELRELAEAEPRGRAEAQLRELAEAEPPETLAEGALVVASLGRRPFEVRRLATRNKNACRRGLRHDEAR